jgi:hypothetical protein
MVWRVRHMKVLPLITPPVTEIRLPTLPLRDLGIDPTGR